MQCPQFSFDHASFLLALPGFLRKFNAENQLPPKDLNGDEKIIEFCIECSKIRMEYPGLCTARFEARQMQAKQNVPNEVTGPPCATDLVVTRS